MADTNPRSAKRIQLVGDTKWWTIIGIVGAAKHRTLNEATQLQGYIPHAQRPQIFTTVAVRTAGDPLRLANAIRQAIWRVDRDQPVWGVLSMDQLLENAVGSPRLIVRLTLGFAIVALLLGAIGIYGVLSYTMSQRTHEVGIRIALGAETRQVVRMVVGEGMRIVAIAVVIGLVASFGVTRTPAQPALWRRPDGRSHLLRRDGAAGRRGDARLLSPGAPGESSGSDGGPAQRLSHPQLATS